jgi:long-subunit fatty acid transport protein
MTRALLLLLIAAPALASQPDLSGLGARSAALAGLGAADAEGYDAAFENPAGAVGPGKPRLTLGYVYGNPELQLDGATRHVAPTRGVLLGLSLPLPLGGFLRDRLGLAIAAFSPLQLVNHARTPFPDEPRLILLDDRTQVVTVLACAAARINDRVTVGAGVAVLATLLGEIRVAPDSSGHLTTLAAEEAALRASPLAGVRVRLLDNLRVGAVVRGSSAADYDLSIHTNLGNAIPLTLPVLRIAGVAQYDPLQAALEAALDATPWLGLRAGATWRRWSAYPHPSEKVTPGAPAALETGFSDTITPRLALEATSVGFGVRLQGRLGYAYEPTPANNNGSFVDASRHLMTLGLGATLARFQLDLFGQLHELGRSSRAAGSLLVVGGTLGMEL